MTVTERDVIAPVETRYAGCHFRSRLEARWAVALDELGIDWHYEPETYDVPEHGWYLPDFLLPRFFPVDDGKPTGLLLEIKAIAPPLAAGGERLVAFGKRVRAGEVEGARAFAIAAGSIPRPGGFFMGCKLFMVDADRAEWLSPALLLGAHGDAVDAALKTARSYRFGEEAA